MLRGGFFATYTYIAHTMTSVAGIPSAWLPLVVALYGLGMVAGNIVYQYAAGDRA